LTFLSKPLLVFPIFGVVGILLGSGAALIVETLDRRFRTPLDLGRDLQVPVLGHIPFKRRSRANLKVPQDDNASLASSLIAHYEPDSAHAEAFRGIRTALFHKSRIDRTKVVQITSPNNGDGKSVFVSNLAISMAQAGRKILLIDADLRRPSLARLFGLRGKPGLGDVLADEAEVADAIEQTIVAGLDVLASGSHPIPPGELASSSRLADLVQILRDKYDMILIDTPPLFAVSDPLAIAEHVDGVLVVLRNSRTAQSMIRRAMERLAAVDAPVIGSVVRATKLRRGRVSFGYDDAQPWIGCYRGYRTSHVNGAGRATGGGSTGN
jgi:capsular exopolysaccharide synthesis family protein